MDPGGEGYRNSWDEGLGPATLRQTRKPGHLTR